MHKNTSENILPELLQKSDIVLEHQANVVERIHQRIDSEIYLCPFHSEF
ncbi:MAG: hypothetical protein ACR2J3_03790 [Aridibacter sp.]